MLLQKAKLDFSMCILRLSPDMAGEALSYLILAGIVTRTLAFVHVMRSAWGFVGPKIHFLSLHEVVMLQL